MTKVKDLIKKEQRTQDIYIVDAVSYDDCASFTSEDASIVAAQNFIYRNTGDYPFCDEMRVIKLAKRIEREFLRNKAERKEQEIININSLRDLCHKATENWWKDLQTGQDLRIPNNDGSLKFNVPEKLCLIHSEISEAMEGYRKNLNDSHLTHMKMLDVELADAVIRIMDLCGAMNIDIDKAIKEKLVYNTERADHKLENRSKNNGKTF